MLVSVQLDLQRAQWLLKQIVDIAKSEHEREDAHHTALEQSDRSGQCQTPSNDTR